MKVKRWMITLVASVVMTMAMAQSLPQFSSTSFDGWEYNNPGIALTASNIGGGKIVLYTASNGLTLTLISPVFPCLGIESISSVVTWYTRNIANSSFDLSRTALTLAIDDEQGNPLDSVTVTPTTHGVSTHTLNFTIAVPQGLSRARLRFVYGNEHRGTLVEDGVHVPAQHQVDAEFLPSVVAAIVCQNVTKSHLVCCCSLCIVFVVLNCN